MVKLKVVGCLLKRELLHIILSQIRLTSVLSNFPKNSRASGSKNTSYIQKPSLFFASSSVTKFPAFILFLAFSIAVTASLLNSG